MDLSAIEVEAIFTRLFKECLPKLEETCREYTKNKIETHSLKCLGKVPPESILKIQEIEKKIDNHLLETEVKVEEKSKFEKRYYDRASLILRVVGVIGASNVFFIVYYLIKMFKSNVTIIP